MRFCYQCGGEIFPGQEYAYSKLGTRHKMPACKDAGVSYEPEPFTAFAGAVTRATLPRMLKTEIRRTERIRDCYLCNRRFLAEEEDGWGIIFEGSWCERQVWKVANWQFWLPPKIQIRFLHYPECTPPYDFPEVPAGIVLRMPRKAAKRRLSKAA